MASTKQKRTYLSLEEKVEVIKLWEKTPGASSRSIAAAFGTTGKTIGKTQAADILKHKDSILAACESSPSGSKRCRVSKFSDINEVLYEWYVIACSKDIHPNGPQLIAKAKKIAATLGKPDFEGSNGWLSKWKARYSLKKACANPADTITSRKETLPEILGGYTHENIYTINETGLLWRVLPSRELGSTVEQCKAGEKSQHRFTLAFLVNATGEKEAPAVIWTSERPQCFGECDISHLPVKYYHQKKAWMSSSILHSYLSTFNLKMKAENRSVVLLLDNAGCHVPGIIRGYYSNIKVVFLPAANGSKRQPLNLGIVDKFKAQYRRLLLQYVLAKMDVSTSAVDVIKCINVLTAIRWVARAWEEVNSITVRRCFQRMGFVSASSAGVDDPVTQAYRSKETVVTSEMRALVSRVMGGLDQCSAEEYVSGDNALPVSFNISDDRWEEHFLSSLTEEEQHVVVDSDVEVEEDLDIPPPVPKITSYKEAAQCLEDVKIFLEDRGCFEQASTVSSLQAHMTSRTLQV